MSHFNFGSDVSFGKRRPATSHILQSPAAPFDDPIRIEDLQAEPDILSEAVGPVENVKDEATLKIPEIGEHFEMGRHLAKESGPP